MLRERMMGVQDAWRAYLELALGLTEASRQKAQQVVRDLAGKGEATAVQAQAMAAELLSTGQTNREALVRLVRYEVDRALGAVGLASADEVAELSTRVQELERRLRRVDEQPAREASPEQPAAKKSTPKPVAKKSVAKKSVAKKSVATKAVAEKPAAKAAKKAV